MKNTIIASSLALSIALAGPVAAASQTKNDIERVSTFSAAALAGALAGGPVGMFIGAIGGAYLSEQSKKIFEENQSLEMEVTALSEEVGHKRVEIVDLENRMVKKLEFQVMFPTGKDELTFQDTQRINSLAKYLKRNPQLKVRLDGYADPRGTDEYNNVLSSERAKAVAKALTERDIADDRISIHYHGSSLATTVDADQDKYAFERRVHIEVFSDTDKERVAASN